VGLSVEGSGRGGEGGEAGGCPRTSGGSSGASGRQSSERVRRGPEAFGDAGGGRARGPNERGPLRGP